MLRLVPIDSINPSSYNPRKADQKRLKILELSLSKLGFVMPIYCDKSGEILSGHQRHHVSKLMGLTHVPVYFTQQMKLNERKALNIAFNRGTNDLAQKDTPKSITEALSGFDLNAVASKVDNKKFDDPLFYRCMKTTSLPVQKLVEVNRGRWVNYARNMARVLYSKKIVMPVICTPDNKVVNGIGRLQYAAEKRWETIEVVYISEEEAELSNVVLNLLSMDFDIHSRYEDLLRYNSFRRSRRSRKELGFGFIFVVAPNTRPNAFDVTEPSNTKLWKKTHGRSVVDFGAGHLTETEILRSIGVHVSCFEPYRLGGSDQISKPESLKIAKAFLDDVASGRRFTSVFISSVLNSVPFEKDRQKIACLCAALCDDKTHLYACASSTIDSVSYASTLGIDALAKRQSTYATFALDYESGITIGDFKEHPKVQKYHSPDEFYDLFKRYFEVVNVNAKYSNVQATCHTPRRKQIFEDLRKAIEFEFDLPYPDGSTMGLVDYALKAYSKRLGVEL
ncbi:ParB N-terminal domain-containing protein [Photobacterium damselae subsp. damselae]|uniref:ParB N-terminal domain-containing protein n=1 Tax=Photobacterium damselae TaxID=38293 RepID=UPI00311B0D53